MKLCKKMFIAFLTLIATLACALLPTAHAEEAEVDTTPNFDEDFESYTIDGGGAQLGGKWTSSWFIKTGDYDEAGCSDKYFAVKADPTNPDNKVLYIDTYQDNSSFFFLTMKDIYVKNFELTYKLYIDYPADIAPWFGITCRKPVDGRYNGVTNVQVLVRSWGVDQLGSDFYRCIGDSHTAVKAKGENNQGDATGYVLSEGETLNRTWLNVKMVANGAQFKVYVNDQMLGMIEVNKASALNYGYVSFVSCVNKCYIDDVHLENLDEQPYTPEGDKEEEGAKAPTMAETEFTYTPGEDLTIPVSLFGEAVSEVKQAATVLLTKYYTVEGDQVTISHEFLSNLSAGRKAFLISTAGGNVMFYVTVPAAQQEQPGPSEPSVPSGTETPTPEENTGSEDNGCGGAIVASIGAVAILSLGVLLLKRKED